MARGTTISLKCIRSDSDSVFRGQEFRRSIAACGHQPKCDAPDAHTNQQVERAVRTVQEVARSVLLHQGAPTKEWPCAVEHAKCLLVRLPSRALGGKTPHHALHGEKPGDLDKFRIFYSPVHITKLTNEKKRSNKFDSTSVEGYYLGASGNDSGHLVRSSRHTKPVCRKDVCFLEDIKGSIDTGLPLDWHSSPTIQDSEQASCQQTSTDVHFEQPEAEGDSDSESDEWPSSTPEEAVETRSVRTRKPRVPHNMHWWHSSSNVAGR